MENEGNMRLKCPTCGEQVNAASFAPGDRILCPGCQTRLKLPSDQPEALTQPNAGPFDFDGAAPLRPAGYPSPRPQAQPVLVPMPYTAEPREYTQEKIKDLRERRQDRREQRQYEREDRVSNGVGIAGFALCATSVLLVVSGAVFSSELKAYAWFAALLALMLTLAGLPCGLIGSLRPGRSRLFAIIGAVLGGMLLLGFIRALMISLTTSK
jgi:hypothetical protein